jgi:hypothetical protein
MCEFLQSVQKDNKYVKIEETETILTKLYFLCSL